MAYYNLDNLNDVASLYYEAVPEEFYRLWTQNQNVGKVGQSRLASLFPQLYTDYGYQMFQNPQLTFTDYLRGVDAENQLAQFSPAARGLDTRRYANALRWIPF